MVLYPAIGIMIARAVVHNNYNYYYYKYNYYSHVSLCRQHQAKQDEVGGGVVLISAWGELHPAVGNPRQLYQLSRRPVFRRVFVAFVVHVVTAIDVDIERTSA